jgi:hypothetical protein
MAFLLAASVAIASFDAEVYQTPPALAAKAAQWLGRVAP